MERIIVDDKNKFEIFVFKHINSGYYWFVLQYHSSFTDTVFFLQSRIKILNHAAFLLTVMTHKITLNWAVISEFLLSVHHSQLVVLTFLGET